ncbi:MAG: hypothetical protein KDI50_01420 [Candidatus Competibacteraceae bacterium]|nr:hypothetical protein [Candidatus Competibacteraceae bacterium]
MLVGIPLFALGERPNYRKTLQYMNHIDPLLGRCFEHWLDWPSVVRQRAVVYCGFNALADAEVAAAVSQGLLADLVAYAGEIYKHGLSVRN